MLSIDFIRKFNVFVDVSAQSRDFSYSQVSMEIINYDSNAEIKTFCSNLLTLPI